MKKTLSFLLALVMLTAMVFPAFAETLDYSVLKDNSLIDVDINNDGNAFIESIIGETTFTHEKSLDDYPSFVYTDIIIGDYYSSDPVSLWRFWVSYSAEKYMGITSISFILDDTEYTFTDVGSKDNMTDYGTNVRENPHINFGSNNYEFWKALIVKGKTYDELTDALDDSLTMILHGTTRDETITLNGSALLDFYIITAVYFELADTSDIMQYDGTPMTTSPYTASAL